MWRGVELCCCFVFPSQAAVSAAKTAEAEASQRWQQYQQEVENAALLYDIKERAAASKELSVSRVTLAALQVSE